MPKKVSFVKRVGRQAYKATGYTNPMKKGRISSTRIAKQVPRLMKDVMRLKTIINSEKKRIEVTGEGIPIGQVNGNNSGHYVADWTPLPSQGTGFNGRDGNSIKWHSSHYSFLFRRQPAAVGPCRIQIQLIKIIGEAYTSASNILGRFIEPDRWITGGTIYDTASDRKPEYFKQYRVLRTKNVYFRDAAYSGQSSAVQRIVNFGMVLKNHHVKWNNNSNTLADGQVICLITMDTGNGNVTTASTLDDIQNTAINTGVTMSFNRLDYYYDN